MAVAIPVHIETLALQAFRNHAQSRIAPGPAPFVVLTGANGAGKTNMLEAVSLLSAGRGLRGAALAEMAARDGPGGFALSADIRAEPGLPPIAVRSFTTAASPDRRRLSINGGTGALAELAQWLSILWLTPAMDRLFTEGAAGRRRFLDRLVLALFPGHAGHSSRYEAAMRARARLLAADHPADPLWLDGLEADMAVHGAALADARRTTIIALQQQLDGCADPAFPQPALALEGDAPPQDWAAILRRNRAADAAAGRITRAPHRIDLAVSHAAKTMPAAQSSTGEQKALLVAMILAHAELVAARTGRVPVLLLDEAAAHLDPGRRAALFARVAQLGGQCWLTGTEPELFAGIAQRSYRVDQGAVTG